MTSATTTPPLSAAVPATAAPATAAPTAASDGATTPGVAGRWAFAIVATVCFTVLGLTWITTRAYEDGTVVTALLAAILGPLAGVGAAAFGVQLQATAKAGKQEAEQEAAAAQTREQQTKQQSRELGQQVRGLVHQVPEGTYVTRDGSEASSRTVTSELERIANALDRLGS